jgi:hypothetical protein
MLGERFKARLGETDRRSITSVQSDLDRVAQGHAAEEAMDPLGALLKGTPRARAPPPPPPPKKKVDEDSSSGSSKIPRIGDTVF